MRGIELVVLDPHAIGIDAALRLDRIVEGHAHLELRITKEIAELQHALDGPSGFLEPSGRVLGVPPDVVLQLPLVRIRSGAARVEPLVRDDHRQDALGDVAGCDGLRLAFRLEQIFECLDPSVSVITAEPVGESQASSLARSFSLGGREVAIRVIAVNARTPLSSVREASQVRVFILDSADEDLVRSVLEIATAEDCVLLPSELDDPKVFDFPATGGQVLSVGGRGRHVGRLDIRPRVGGDGLELRFQEIEVSQELINDPRLVDLYKSYQGIVRDSHLMDRVVRVPLPEGGRFTGSSRCQDCHEEVYAIWQDRGHAHAYGTLVKVGSDMDPECVVCHVVGMEFEEGFVSLEKTPQFPNVGCEVCHGPGADHVVSGGSIDLGQPRRSCLHCHTPEHSGEFAEHREEYREKIKHW